MTRTKALFLKSLSLILFVLIAACAPRNKYKYPFLNPSLSNEERAENIVSLLTLDEKIQQMMNNAPPVERLGIPAYNWWNEALHGVARSPYNVTSYPQAIGMASTWDTASLRLMAHYSAEEGRAIFNDSKKRGITGIYVGLTYWTPNINIFRDPRWGRGQETYGEDPYLTGEMGKALVNGLQGNHPRYLKASACAKHFAVHSGPEWNRSTFNSRVSDYDLWDTYLPAFRDLVIDAKVSGVMCAYNRFDDQPCCGNDKLMIDILRNKWGFSGYVTSDCGAISLFWRTHKTHPTPQAAASDAVLHGTDSECSGDGAYKSLVTAVTDSLITEKEIDVSLKRLFIVRLRLGMFDPDDMVPYSKIDTTVLESEAHKAHALRMARESMILLKNELNLLPLSKRLKKIAVVGPNANDEAVMLANYYGYPSEVTTVLEGIRQKLDPSTEILYEKGVNLTDDLVFKSEFQSKFFISDDQEGFKAEYFKNTKLEGPPELVRNEKTIDFRWGDGKIIADSIIARQMSIRWSASFVPEKQGEVTFMLTGDDGCRLIIDRDVKIDSRNGNPYYTLKTQTGKTYKVAIEYWQYNDNAEAKFDMGYFEKSSPTKIASRVRNADAIIYVGGISSRLEGEQMKVEIEGFNGGDRTTLDLPRVQTELLKALKATGKPVVFVSMSGSAISFNWEAENIPAIIQAWYGGQSGGMAVADVLFGDYNPAGRLPVTFYKNVKDLPDFEDYSMENRTYRYFKGETLFPFGHGLSYTTFRYDSLKVNDKVPANANLIVRVNVTNTGKVAGDEVVQLYLTHKLSGIRTPARALKGFKRIHLNAGETQVVSFNVMPDKLYVLNADGTLLPPVGELEISVGGAQPSQKLIAEGMTLIRTVELAVKN